MPATKTPVKSKPRKLSWKQAKLMAVRALNKLEKLSPDEIAKVLTPKLRYKCITGSPENCAIAEYLFRTIFNRASVQVTMSVGSWYTHVRGVFPDSDEVTAERIGEHGPNVQRFIRRFDEGEYPNLLLINKPQRKAA